MYVEDKQDIVKSLERSLRCRSSSINQDTITSVHYHAKQNNESISIHEVETHLRRAVFNNEINEVLVFYEIVHE